MKKIQIFAGSVMGTANGVAKTAEQILMGLGHDTVFYQTFDKNLFDTHAITLVCTSSTGMGDLPENIQPFYNHLRNDSPNIVGMLYGIISLGDSSYPNFAQAGKSIDDALADLGARRIGEPLVMDALLVDDHEEEASTWIYAWEQQIIK